MPNALSEAKELDILPMIYLCTPLPPVFGFSFFLFLIFRIPQAVKKKIWGDSCFIRLHRDVTEPVSWFSCAKNCCVLTPRVSPGVLGKPKWILISTC